MKVKIALFVVIICALAVAAVFLIPSKKESITSLTEKISKPDVYVFTSNTCPYCRQFKQEYFPVLKKEFKDKVNFWDIVLSEDSSENDYRLYYTMSAQCKMNGVPLVVVGNNCMGGYPHNIKGNTKAAIESVLNEQNKH